MCLRKPKKCGVTVIKVKELSMNDYIKDQIRAVAGDLGYKVETDRSSHRRDGNCVSLVPEIATFLHQQGAKREC